MTPSTHRTAPNWRALLAFVLLPGAFALAACGDDPVAIQDPETVQFAPELNVDLSQMERKEGGVYIRTLQVGTGDSIISDTMVVDYTVWLADGTVVGAGEFDVDLDRVNVIPGFYIGVYGMRLNELRQIVIPPDLAYGTQGVPDANIPGGAVLVYEVEAIGTKPDSTDTTTTTTALDRLHPVADPLTLRR